MKEKNQFSLTEETEIKLILSRILLGHGNPQYLQSMLRNRYSFYISDFNFHSLPRSFRAKDFEHAKINGDIIANRG